MKVGFLSLSIWIISDAQAAVQGDPFVILDHATSNG
jgi:hypothetical protein